MTKNLISITKLTKENNIYLEFHPDCFFLKDMHGRVLLKGILSNGLYRLPSQVDSGGRSALVGERKTSAQWHNRFGYPSQSILSFMLRQFNILVSSNKAPMPCQSCSLGKSHRLPIMSSHVSKTTPFDLIYSDVWGPAPLLSLNGNRYFVLFVDDCTRFTWIYFMSQKSQVLYYFKIFQTMIKTQFNASIKELQTYWGGEYCTMSTLLQQQGIKHRVPCPHTPSQNGMVEHRNRTIQEKGLTLLAQSCLPSEFWEHAFHTAIFLHNCTPTPILKTPLHTFVSIIVPQIISFLEHLVVYVFHSWVHIGQTNSNLKLFHVYSWVIVHLIRAIYVTIRSPLAHK